VRVREGKREEGRGEVGEEEEKRYKIETDQVPPSTGF